MRYTSTRCRPVVYMPMRYTPMICKPVRYMPIASRNAVVQLPKSSSHRNDTGQTDKCIQKTNAILTNVEHV